MAKTKVFIVDSISHLSSEARGKIVVCGSHGGKAAGAYMVAYHPRAVVFNDAGVGKNRAGIGALTALERKGIAGIAVSARSARIGEGRDTFQSGIVSYVNRTASGLGIKRDMKAKHLVRFFQ